MYLPPRRQHPGHLYWGVPYACWLSIISGSSWTWGHLMAFSWFHLFAHLRSGRADKHESAPLSSAFPFLALSKAEVGFLCRPPGSGLGVLSAKTLVKTREHGFPKGLFRLWQRRNRETYWLFLVLPVPSKPQKTINKVLAHS